VVICLERGADLHMAPLMPLPLTVSCFSKIQIGFTFLTPAHPGSLGQRAVERARACVYDTRCYLNVRSKANMSQLNLPHGTVCVCVRACVCVCVYVLMLINVFIRVFRVQAISLGQGQGPVAEKLIANAARTGDWVFLQVSSIKRLLY